MSKTKKTAGKANAVQEKVNDDWDEILKQEVEKNTPNVIVESSKGDVMVADTDTPGKVIVIFSYRRCITNYKL